MTGAGGTALTLQRYATTDGLDEITDGMIACARQLRHLGARIPVPRSGWRLPCKVANLETLLRYAEDLGIEVIEQAGIYRAVLPFGPGVAYVLWTEAAQPDAGPVAAEGLTAGSWPAISSIPLA